MATPDILRVECPNCHCVQTGHLRLKAESFENDNCDSCGSVTGSSSVDVTIEIACAQCTTLLYTNTIEGVSCFFTAPLDWRDQLRFDALNDAFVEMCIGQRALSYKEARKTRNKAFLAALPTGLRKCGCNVTAIDAEKNEMEFTRCSKHQLLAGYEILFLELA